MDEKGDDDLSWIERAAREKGNPAPKIIQDRPELRDDLEFYLMAFYELSTCRYLGYGCVGPIPWKAIVEFIQYYQIGYSDDFLYLIRRIDSAFLDFHRKQKKEKQNG